MPVPEISARTTRILRVAMLGVIAAVALANAAGWVDADLWIPFVCIIAVMGVGTRGGPVDRLSFVLIEASVVLLLGVATFSGSRDAVWVASVAVSVLAIGKIALVELHRRDAELEAKEVRREVKERDAQAMTRSQETTLGRRPPPSDASVSDASAVREAAPRAAESSSSGPRAMAEPVIAERPPIPRTISELPPPPMLPAPTSQHDATPPLARTEPDPRPKKRRDRDDPTPRAVPIRR